MDQSPPHQALPRLPGKLLGQTEEKLGAYPAIAFYRNFERKISSHLRDGGARYSIP